MQAQLRPDPARGAGYGVIDLEEFEGREADVLFSLRRASDGKYLGSGDWLEAERRLTPDVAQRQDAGVRLLVGPAVVDMVDALDSFAITVYPVEGESLSCRLEVGDLVYSALAGGQGVSRQIKMPPPPTRSRASAPPPMPPLASDFVPESAPASEAASVPPPVPEPGPHLALPKLKDPVDPRRGMALRPLLLLLAIACAGGGLYAWKQSASAPPATAASAAKSASPASPHLQRARELLRSGISPEGALEMAKGMRTPDGADGAFLLLEDAAQRGKSEAMLLLARFYDPTDDAPKGSIRPDPEQARDWYVKARDGGQGAAEERLKNLRAWAEAEKDRDPQARKLPEGRQ